MNPYNRLHEQPAPLSIFDAGQTLSSHKSGLLYNALTERQLWTNISRYSTAVDSFAPLTADLITILPFHPCRSRNICPRNPYPLSTLRLRKRQVECTVYGIQSSRGWVPLS